MNFDLMSGGNIKRILGLSLIPFVFGGCASFIQTQIKIPHGYQPDKGATQNLEQQHGRDNDSETIIYSGSHERQKPYCQGITKRYNFLTGGVDSNTVRLPDEWCGIGMELVNNPEKFNLSVYGSECMASKNPTKEEMAKAGDSTVVAAYPVDPGLCLTYGAKN